MKIYKSASSYYEIDGEYIKMLQNNDENKLK